MKLLIWFVVTLKTFSSTKYLAERKKTSQIIKASKDGEYSWCIIANVKQPDNCKSSFCQERYPVRNMYNDILHRQHKSTLLLRSLTSDLTIYSVSYFFSIVFINLFSLYIPSSLFFISFIYTRLFTLKKKFH